MSYEIDALTADVTVFAWCFNAARMIPDLDIANRQVSEMVCQAQLALMDLYDRMEQPRYEMLDSMIVKAVDCWRMARDWEDRVTAANMAVKALWEVSAALYPDLPHAIPEGAVIK